MLPVFPLYSLANLHRTEMSTLCVRHLPKIHKPSEKNEMQQQMYAFSNLMERRNAGFPKAHLLEHEIATVALELYTTCYLLQNLNAYLNLYLRKLCYYMVLLRIVLWRAMPRISQ